MDMLETEFPVTEDPEASASREVNRSDKIKELENEIMELKLLDRYIKSVNETLQRASSETRSTCDQVALMYVKLQQKNIKLTKKAQRMYKVIKSFRYKLAPRRPKPRDHRGLEVLAEVAEAYNQQAFKSLAGDRNLWQ